MLTSLHVRDFAIVHEISVDFANGMTVLTGETGAGKSILVDALGLVLGDRGSAQMVRQGAKRAEFSAEFDLVEHAAARLWLDDQAMDAEDCVVRRVISGDGRSRGFINGNPVPLQQLKAFGELLLDIHGQHFHQSLGRRDIQRNLLDHFGGLIEDRREVADAFDAWDALHTERETLKAQEADRASRIELLEFQLDEFERLALKDGELEELETERQRLLHSGKLAEGVNRSLELLSDADANAGQALATARRELEELSAVDDGLREALELVQSAEIQVSEACDALVRHADSVEADPARQQSIEERLDAMTSIARKHRIPVAELMEKHGQLDGELHTLKNAERISAELEEQLAAAERHFNALAEALSIRRQTTASAFSAEVTDAMAGLGMPGGVFDARVIRSDTPRAWGIDRIEFLISANPGQAPQSLAKVASGGELARMSLAIQVIASDGSAIPTMIFDEVDSGVGGGVAEMVGLRLAELGAKRQVLCVTHLPQVASLAHQHLRVSKVSDGNATRTGIAELGQQERIEELARMLGGVDITQTTLDHAAEMLNEAARKRA